MNAVRIVAVETFFNIESPSAAFGFGASAVGDLTLAHVCVRVADRKGREVEGWGAIFLSHPWAYPGTAVDPAEKGRRMRAFLDATGQATVERGAFGHPLDHFLDIEARLSEAEMPRLAALVAISPLDAAIHDAYGKLHGISAYAALGPEFVGWDLSRVLGDPFVGQYFGDYVRSEPIASLPIAHTVGTADPLTIGDRIGAYPSLAEWIASDGVRNFKVKLKGKDLAWDVARLREVHTVASGISGADVRLYADLNEQGPSLAYLVALLDDVRDTAPDALAALVSLEQPSSRNLGLDAIDVHAISRRIPVVLDEGLVSLTSIDRAAALGWNGIALKTCKTQSLMLLALAKATELGLHVSVQDLTNPGIALPHSAGLAARLPAIEPMESNQRQYFPETSTPEATRFPGIYAVRDGAIPTALLDGPGLGYGDLATIPRDIFAIP
ncbi:MAG: enolase C-terminal domain-like protein [Thermomicrobiales bacterium]